MKGILFLSLVSAAIAQTGTGSIQGTILDGRTQKPIPSALVMVIRDGVPPFSASTKSGGAGEFQFQGLSPGTYSLCVQAEGDEYVNPCQWNGSPTTVRLVSGQAAKGLSLRLTAASVLSIQIQDLQNTLNQKTKDGRRPELMLGVWGPKGLYYPAHLSASTANTGTLKGEVIYNYRLAVPRDTALNFHVASRDLILGDASGKSLPINASTQAFQHTTGDPNPPKSFAFSVLGLRP